MSTTDLDHRERPKVGQVCWMNEEIAELSLLLPGWQTVELETLACSRHLTLGQLIRQVISEYLACRPPLNEQRESEGLCLTDFIEELV